MGASGTGRPPRRSPSHHNVGLLPYSPLGGGALSGKYRGQPPPLAPCAGFRCRWLGPAEVHCRKMLKKYSHLTHRHTNHVPRGRVGRTKGGRAGGGTWTPVRFFHAFPPEDGLGGFSWPGLLRCTTIGVVPPTKALAIPSNENVSAWLRHANSRLAASEGFGGPVGGPCPIRGSRRARHFFPPGV